MAAIFHIYPKSRPVADDTDRRGWIYPGDGKFGEADRVVVHSDELAMSYRGYLRGHENIGKTPESLTRQGFRRFLLYNDFREGNFPK